MEIASSVIVAQIVVNFVLMVVSGFGLWHQFMGCPGISVQDDFDRAITRLEGLDEALQERTKRLERVKAGIVRERGIVEAKAKRGADSVPDGEGVTEADIAWLQAQVRDGGD